MKKKRETADNTSTAFVETVLNSISSDGQILGSTNASNENLNEQSPFEGTSEHISKLQNYRPMLVQDSW